MLRHLCLKPTWHAEVRSAEPVNQHDHNREVGHCKQGVRHLLQTELALHSAQAVRAVDAATSDGSDMKQQAPNRFELLK